MPRVMTSNIDVMARHNLTLPRERDALAHILDTPAEAAKWLEDGRFSELTDAYIEAAGDAKAQERVDRILATHGVRGGEASIRRPAMGGAGNADVSPRHVVNSTLANWTDAPGRKLDGAFNSFGEYLRAISPMQREMNGLPEKLRNEMGSTNPSAGGFLVPEQYRSELLSVSLETSIVRPRAFVVPMSSGSLVLPKIDATTNVGSVFGGIAAQWTAEGGTIADSGPTFGRTRLEAAKLALRCDVPNELIADASPALDVVTFRLFAESLSFEEDGAFLTGGGAGQPLGVLNSPAAITVAKETNQPDGTIVYENLTNIFSRMLSRSRQRAVWICSDACIPELLQLSIPVGTGGSHVPVMSERGGQFTILGRPVFFTEHVPTIGSEGDIGLYDLAYYLIGDRGEMRLESSPHVKFTTDETVYRGIHRVDGRGWVDSAITPRNGGPTQSPFVKLGARA